MSVGSPLRTLAVAAVSAATLLVACGDFADRVSANVVTVNLLLETGDPFDLTPRQAGVLVNLSAITGPLNDPSTSGISGAGVTMVGDNAPAVTVQVPENGPGSYLSSTGGGAVFVYQSNASYTVTMVIPSGEFADTYTTQVIAPPRTDVTGLPDSTMGQFHTAGTDLTLTVVGSYDRGLVVVLDQGGNITYDSRPQTPQQWVDFVLGDFTGTLTIPGTAFPDAGQPYGLVISGLESAQSSGISSNLHILSRFFAGSAKTAIVVTQ